jgi:hypothetical protein
LFCSQPEKECRVKRLIPACFRKSMRFIHG